jgi:hypothetical protein
MERKLNFFLNEIKRAGIRVTEDSFFRQEFDPRVNFDPEGEHEL